MKSNITFYLQVEVVSQLLGAGAHRHVVDNSGLTPLMVAVHGAEMMDGENMIEVVNSTS